MIILNGLPEAGSGELSAGWTQHSNSLMFMFKLILSSSGSIVSNLLIGSECKPDRAFEGRANLKGCEILIGVPFPFRFALGGQ